MNIESRADGFEYYEIVSADDSDPYAGCVRADVLVPFLDSAVSIETVKAALNERKIPTLNALAQRWQEGKGASKSRMIPLSSEALEDDGKVPERLTVDRANQLLDQAQAQGIEGAATLVVHNGRTGESLEYAVIVLDSEGNPYYQVGAADNQAPQDQASYLKALTPAPEGTLAWQFTPNGLRYIAVNERNRVIYQFNLDNEDWEPMQVDVPKADMLTLDELEQLQSKAKQVHSFSRNQIDAAPWEFLVNTNFEGFVIGVTRETDYEEYENLDLYHVVVFTSDGPKYFSAYTVATLNDRNYTETKAFLAGELSEELALTRGKIVAIISDRKSSSEGATSLCERFAGVSGSECNAFFEEVGVDANTPLSTLFSDTPTTSTPDFKLLIIAAS